MVTVDIKGVDRGGGAVVNGATAVVSGLEEGGDGLADV